MAQSIPESLVKSLEGVHGFSRDSFLEAQTQAPPVSIRFNPNKNFDLSNWIYADLMDHSIPWCSNRGFYLKERPSFTADPWFHGGAYYVQEASSQFLQHALQQTVDLTKSLRVLDLCAAPGGKSTLIQSLLSEQSILVSNEVIRTRVPILMENLIKWGTANVVVTQNDPADFSTLPHFFDMVVVDAPCSGSGLFRKDPDAIDIWNPDLVGHCKQRQQRILKDFWPTLRPGGMLIYSTCSFSTEENEEMVDWILQQFEADSIQLPDLSNWNVIETTSDLKNGKGYRFYPDKLKGEGFFLSVFQKNGSFISGEFDQRKNGKVKVTSTVSKQAKAEVLNRIPKLGEMECMMHENRALFMSKNMIDALPILQHALYVRMAGLEAGSFMRDQWIPGHAAAMYGHLMINEETLALDLPQALNYLRRSTDFNCDHSGKGWQLVQYRGLVLGWIKSIGNRINNYYPKEWRILNK